MRSAIYCSLADKIVSSCLIFAYNSSLSFCKSLFIWPKLTTSYLICVILSTKSVFSRFKEATSVLLFFASLLKVAILNSWAADIIGFLLIAYISCLLSTFFAGELLYNTIEGTWSNSLGGVKSYFWIASLRSSNSAMASRSPAMKNRLSLVKFSSYSWIMNPNF